MAESAQDKEKTDPPKKDVQELESAIVRFAGDSGDGIQLTGSRFTITTALQGNDLATLPDFPAEIRAPVGTLAGVSAFQINFSHHKILTPGDMPDVLVAFNPAALKANIQDLKPGGTVIVNSATFEKRNLQKADYDSNPLEDGSLKGFQVIPVDISRMVKVALADMGLSVTAVDRSKNFFALGLMYWRYNRPIELTLKWLEEKFAGKSDLIEANSRTLRAGYHFGETAEVFPTSYQVREAIYEPCHLQRRYALGDACDLLRPQAHHLFVVDRVVVHVARYVFLLDTTDPMLEAGGAWAHPGPGKCLGVSDIGLKTFGVGPEGDGKFWQILDRRDAPRLGPVTEVAVGEQDDRRHVSGCQPNGLDGHVKTIRGGGWGNNRDRGLAVAPVKNLKEVGLFGLGG